MCRALDHIHRLPRDNLKSPFVRTDLVPPLRQRHMRGTADKRPDRDDVGSPLIRSVLKLLSERFRILAEYVRHLENLLARSHIVDVYCTPGVRASEGACDLNAFVRFKLNEKTQVAPYICYLEVGYVIRIVCGDNSRAGKNKSSG